MWRSVAVEEDAPRDYALTSHWKTRYNGRRAAANIGREQAAARQIRQTDQKGGNAMSSSVYKIIELVGTSTESWDDAARAAVERASSSLRDLRIAEVVKLDLQIKDGKVEAYRAKISVSFKYEEKE